MPCRIREFRTRTARDFLAALSPTDGLFAETSSTIFRGVAGSSYPLVASGYRTDGRVPLARLVGDQVRNLERFCEIADREGLRVPGDSDEMRNELDRFLTYGNSGVGCASWPPQSLVPALALAQHHGIGTPLLDFTLNPFIAAYFAGYQSLKPELKRCVVVWVADLSHMPSRVSFVKAPMAENDNMRAQEGCFLLKRLHDGIGADDHPTQLPGLEYDFGKGDRGISRVTLPGSETNHLFQVLSRLGYRAARLFPGYTGVARELDELPYGSNASGGPPSADLVRKLREKGIVEDLIDLA
jgi:hypothetical protein